MSWWAPFFFLVLTEAQTLKEDEEHPLVVGHPLRRSYQVAEPKRAQKFIENYFGTLRRFRYRVGDTGSCGNVVMNQICIPELADRKRDDVYDEGGGPYEWELRFASTPKSPHGPMNHDRLEDYLHSKLKRFSTATYWLDNMEHSAFMAHDLSPFVKSFDRDLIPYVLTYSNIQVGEGQQQPFYSLWVEIPNGILWRIASFIVNPKFAKKAKYKSMDCDSFDEEDMDFSSSHGDLVPWYELVRSTNPKGDAEFFHDMATMSFLGKEDVCYYVHFKDFSGSSLHEGVRIVFAPALTDSDESYDMTKVIQYRTKIGLTAIETKMRSQYMENYIGIYLGDNHDSIGFAARLKKEEIPYMYARMNQYDSISLVLPHSGMAFEFSFVDWNKGDGHLDFPIPGCREGYRKQIEYYESIVHADKPAEVKAGTLRNMYKKAHFENLHLAAGNTYCPDQNVPEEWGWLSWPCSQYLPPCYVDLAQFDEELDSKLLGNMSHPGLRGATKTPKKKSAVTFLQ